MASVKRVAASGKGSLWSHYGFESEVTGLRRRRLLVYLPAGYREETARRYPVLYLLDGQNAFDLPGSRGGGWKIHLALDQLVAAREVRPIILVAVSHSDQRLKEYCGWSQDPDYSHPLGEKHADYLCRVVKPYIDATYKTMGRRGQTAIAGASAGGVAALYAALTHPGTFFGVGCMSAGRHFFREMEQRFLNRASRLRVFLSCGTEGMDTEFLPQNRAFHRILKRTGVDIELKVSRGHAHDERAWSRVVPELLRFLYAR
ncbi:MAG: alpha/beta hydrolase-fold protein [Candidatus Eremiobacterota bacterium]